jgi:hypothetical protein
LKRFIRRIPRTRCLATSRAAEPTYYLFSVFPPARLQGYHLCPCYRDCLLRLQVPQARIQPLQLVQVDDERRMQRKRGVKAHADGGREEKLLVGMMFAIMMIFLF